MWHGPEALGWHLDCVVYYCVILGHRVDSQVFLHF